MSDNESSNVVKVTVGSPAEAEALRADMEEILRRVNRSLEREPAAQRPVRADLLLHRIDQIIDLHLLALPATPELLALAPKIKSAARSSVLAQAGSAKENPQQSSTSDPGTSIRT